MFSVIRRQNIRNFTTRVVSCSSSSLASSKEQPGKVVFISQSTDIYSNLALEDWLYKNWDFSKRNILFLWRNSPCVVIGRHQNPFSEANISYLDSAGVPIVRRNSGGGTVYHDDGNLNCSFFTSKERYNRRWNLNLICSALKKDFNVTTEINKKDDIVIESSYKISGTAAKLGRLTAYHHCSLLVSSDKLQLKLALKGDKTLKSKATASVLSSVVNLQDFVADLTVEKVISSIGKHFLMRSYSNEMDEASTYLQSDGFALVNPTEEWFPGLDAIRTNLMSWEWLYGMTPLFTASRPVTVDPSVADVDAVVVAAEVYRGLIRKLTVETSVDERLRHYIENQIGSSVQGAKYTPEFFDEVKLRIIAKDKPQLFSVH